GMKVNDDGSITLRKPFVAMPGGSRMLLYPKSGPGVCRYFGFPKYVSLKSNSYGNHKETVSINENGKIDKLLHRDNFHLWTYNNSIEEITCRY
ncbi:MAG: hypothetical protein ABIG11_05745, partial [bacterium]